MPRITDLLTTVSQILNVLGNALKYTSEGHVRVRLHASSSTSSASDEVTLMVSDTGCGMSEEFQATGLFVPWSQEDSMAPGTGLGLSIIKRIVDDIGGNITIRSEKRVGTTVEVRAVLVRADKETKVMSTDSARPLDSLVVGASGISTTDPPHIQAPPQPPPQAPPIEDSPLTESIIPVSPSAERTTKRFLLVDDNDINLRLLVMYMKKQGYYYETASNGLEALHAFQGVRSNNSQSEDGKSAAEINTPPANATADFMPFDYVLMDISMPVMDGLESTRRIRAYERRLAGERRSIAGSRRAATIIALTGLGSTQTRQDAFASGVDMYMTKPFKIAHLAKITANEP